MPAYTVNTLPSSSKLLQKRWINRSYMKHKEKLYTVKPTLGFDAPRVWPHLLVNLKHIQKEEEKQGAVDRENQILLQKLTHILRSGGGIDSKNERFEKHVHKSLRSGYNEKVKQKMLYDNYHIVRRLNGVKAFYDNKSLRKDFKTSRYRLHHILDDTTKDFEEQSPLLTLKPVQTSDPTAHPGGCIGSPIGSYHPSVPGGHQSKKGTSRSGIETPLSRSSTAHGVGVDSGYLVSPTHTHKRGTDKQSTATGYTFRSRHSGRLSTPKSSLEYRKIYKRFPMEETESSEEEDKSRAELDARMLSKAIGGLGQPNEILIRCLAKRKLDERLATAKKFNEIYGLDLASELKDGLGKTYAPLIDCLLENLDHHRASQLHEAIRNVNTMSIFDILLSTSPSQVQHLKSSYHKRFTSPIETDLQEFIASDLCVIVLKALLKGIALTQPVDKEKAKNDAAELLRTKGKEFLTPKGVLVTILTGYGPKQVKALCKEYRKQNEANTSLSDLAVSQLSKSKDERAVYMLPQLLEAIEGDGHTNRLVHALNDRVATDNKDFIKELLVLKEDDGLQDALRAFKKEFKKDLVDEIPIRCKDDAAGVLMALAEKSVPITTGAKENKGKASKPSNQTTDQSLNSSLTSSMTHLHDHPDFHPHRETLPPNPLNKPTARQYAVAALQRKRASARRPSQDILASMNPPKGSVSEPGSVQPPQHKSMLGQTGPIKSSEEGHPIQDDDETSPVGEQWGVTIQANPKFSAKDDVQILHDSLIGFGVDDANVVDILTSNSNRQRQTLSDKYFDLYTRDLLADLKKNSPASYSRFLAALFQPTKEVLVHAIHRGIVSDNFKSPSLDPLIIGLLISLSNKEITAVCIKYHAIHDREMVDDLSKQGEAGKWMKLILEGSGIEESTKDRAKKLSELKPPIHHTEDTLRTVFSMNRLQIRPVFQELSVLKRRSNIEETVQNTFSKESAPTLINILTALADPIKYLTTQLHQHLETNVDLFSELIVYMSEVNLVPIKKCYSKLYSVELEADIAKIITSPLKKFVIRLVRGNIK